jgi:hypothetical protein
MVGIFTLGAQLSSTIPTLVLNSRFRPLDAVPPLAVALGQQRIRGYQRPGDRAKWNDSAAG